MKKNYTIDATGKKLGRIASEAAVMLMGKKDPSFERNVDAPIAVAITNAAKADVREKKMEETKYAEYSGYPGGLRYSNMKQISGRKGYAELFRIAIKGMLPANKLRNERMKRLTISE